MMFKININEFKHLVIFQKFKSTIDDDGFPKEEWVDTYKTRARISNTSGKEFQSSDGTANSISTKFTTRYIKNANIEVQDRIIFNNNIYNITYINNIQEECRYIEIVAERMI